MTNETSAGPRLAGNFRRDISRPTFVPPPGACDSHMHIVGPFNKYPVRESRSLSPREATLDDYILTMNKLGLSRCVIVQPSFFAKDNACTLDAVEALGERARGVVVIDSDTDEGVLEHMHIRGVRGVRVQSVVAGGANPDDIEAIAARIKPLGWHLQLFMDGKNIPHLAPRLMSLGIDVVFDHMAQVDAESEPGDPGFKALLKMLDGGRTWVKMSDAFSKPDAARARRLIAANEDRVLWGSDWPHLGYATPAPDDGELLGALTEWTQDASTLKKILVGNPERLYFA